MKILMLNAYLRKIRKILLYFSTVTPQYLWTVQKISNSRIHGSNPIATHGRLKSVDGGLQLNGVDAWLDAGDFYGQCLGDPDLCIKGFSFALQVLNLVLCYSLCKNLFMLTVIKRQKGLRK